MFYNPLLIPWLDCAVNIITDTLSMYKSSPTDSIDHSYNTYNDTSFNSSYHEHDTDTITIKATQLQYYYSIVTIIRGVVARLILLYALITMNTISYPYIFIVLFESVYNTYIGYRTQTYFPGSMYNSIYTITTGNYWTGDFIHSNQFTLWIKLRMFLLVISLNLSVSIAFSDNYTRSNDKTIVHTVRVLIPLILELSTILLNTVFTLTLYTEIFVRLVRYGILIVLNIISYFTDTLHSISHKLHLLPVTLTTYKPIASSSSHNDLESGFMNYDSNDTYDGNSELFVYTMNTIFWPIYTFTYKWIGY